MRTKGKSERLWKKIMNFDASERLRRRRDKKRSKIMRNDCEFWTTKFLKYNLKLQRTMMICITWISTKSLYGSWQNKRIVNIYSRLTSRKTSFELRLRITGSKEWSGMVGWTKLYSDLQIYFQRRIKSKMEMHREVTRFLIF